jgi:cytochrome c-type biogenesis protein CcmH
MIWFVFAIVTACVILAAGRPLGRAATPAAAPAPEQEAYKLQLAELSRQEERGEIGKEEAEQTRTEISRRLLKASRQGSSSAPMSGKGHLSANAAFFALASFIAIGSVGLYALYGNPSLPDQPLEARLNAPPAEQSIAIQIANVERRLRANPKDALGWSVIAPVYFKMGEFDKAADAYRRAIELGGPNEDKLLGLFEALTFAKEGEIPPEAKPALEAALARNPKSLRGRFWLAALASQDGRKADAEQTYREMLSENISSGWKGLILKQLAALNQEPADEEKNTAGAPAAMPQGEQAAMIRGMVEKLAARLKENPADLDGWLKLIRSYAVLKEPAKAQEAAASAREQFASEPEALGQIDAQTKQLGLAGQGTSQAPAEAQPGGNAMIGGMVQRLAARLKENGADLDGWLMLIRSYAVLQETAKAQEAAASARKQFASEPEALGKIDSLTQGLGLKPEDGKGGQPKS